MQRQLDLFDQPPQAKGGKIDPQFLLQAKEFALRFLADKGQASGEDITDACKAAGIVPRSDKWFGSVYSSLRRAKAIRVAGIAKRRRGHSSPGYLWELVK